jgi:hypothetical protein
MDMKRILQAMDGVAKQPVKGASDMSKFLSIIDKNDVSIIKEEVNNNKVLNEGANPHKVTLPVQMAMQHYQKPTKRFVAEKTVIRTGLTKFFTEVEEEIQEEQNAKKQLMRQYASNIAERVMMKEGKDGPYPDSTFAGSKVGQKPGIAGQLRGTDKAPKGQRAATGKLVGEDHASPFNDQHTMGFGVQGGDPGIQSNVAEAPLNFNQDEPLGSEIVNHKGVNPASIQARMMRARRQLKELADWAESNDPGVWQHIANLFPELEMNIEQVRHGLEELAKVKKMGGTRTRNIPSSVSEAKEKKEIPSTKPRNFVAKNAMATTSGSGAHTDKKKQQKQGYEKHKSKAYEDVMEELAKIKPMKAKKKTTSCRTGQVQTGTQIKDGKVTPKCTVRQSAK